MFPPIYRGFMSKLRHPEFIEGRSLPQRNGKLNNSPRPNYISPLLIRRAGFNANAILLDAQISGGILFHWAKKVNKKISRVIRRHIFGLFVISFSTLQALSPTVDVVDLNRNVVKRPSVTFISDSIIAKQAPTFQRPVGGSLSQKFWYIHPAIDIPNPYGTKVRPVNEGQITFAGWDGGYGYSVVIKHKAGFASRYAHLSKISVKRGSKITKKTVIGLVGATGFATGSHLHLEIYNNGKVVDPEKYLPKN